MTFLPSTSSTADERILYAYCFLPSHLKEAGSIDRFHNLLSNLEFLQRKLAYFGVELVLSDFELVEARTDLKLVGAAIRKSAHTIRAAPTTFLREVIGRLLWDSSDLTEISDLITSAYNLITGPSLVPLTPVLMAADEPLLRNYHGHQRGVTAVALSKDNRVAVSSSWDGTLKLWDMQEGRLIRDLLNITAVAVEFSQDMNAVFVGAQDAVVTVGLEGDIQQIYRGRRGLIGLVRLSHDGTKVLGTSGPRILSGNNSIAVWDTSSGELLCLWDVTETQVVSLEVSYDSAIVVSGFKDGRIRVWDLNALQEVPSRLPEFAQFAQIESLCIFDHIVVVADYGMTSRARISAWDVLTAKMLWQRTLKNDSVSLMRLDSSRQLLVVTGLRGYIYVLNLKTGEIINWFTGDTQEIPAIALSSNGRIVLAGLQNGLLRSWKIFTLSRFEPAIEISGEMIALDICHDGTIMVLGNRDKAVSVHNVLSKNLFRRFNYKKMVEVVAISPKSDLIAVNQGKDIIIERMQDGQTVITLFGHESDVSACYFSYRSDKLFSGDAIGIIKVWDLKSGKCLLTIPAHTDKIRAIDIDEVDTIILAGSDDKTASVWNYITGQHVATMHHEQDVTSVACALQKDTIFTGCDDGIVKQWVFANNEIVRSQTIIKLPSWILGVSVSLDENYALFHSFDGSLIWWNVERNEQFDSIQIEDKLWTSKISGDGSMAVAGGTRIHVLKLLR